MSAAILDSLSKSDNFCMLTVDWNPVKGACRAGQSDSPSDFLHCCARFFPLRGALDPRKNIQVLHT